MAMQNYYSTFASIQNWNAISVMNSYAALEHFFVKKKPIRKSSLVWQFALGSLSSIRGSSTNQANFLSRLLHAKTYLWMRAFVTRNIRLTFMLKKSTLCFLVVATCHATLSQFARKNLCSSSLEKTRTLQVRKSVPIFFI